MKISHKITAALLSLTLLIPAVSCGESESPLSAYDVAVKNGFIGSELEWLDSLKGEPGETGARGEDGKDGSNGLKGEDGKDGVNGTNGIDGIDGVDGVNVVDAYVNDDLHLIVVLSNGDTIDAGYVGTDRDLGSGKPEFASSYECIRPGELYIADCDTKGLAWKSSDTSVARVTADGLILGVAEGECTVTATSYTGESTQCVIRVVDLSYKWNASGGITITSYNGIGKELVIPEKLSGATVTEIDSYAFMMHETMESVVLPDTLVKIGDGAFSNCEKLRSVTFGSSLKSIGAAAFSETALTTVDLPESLTDIGSTAFYNTDIESVKIPAGVKTIRAFCFSECRKLSSVDLGSVERLDNFAFDTCKSLTEITLPATLLSIGDQAFGSCSSLATVIFLNPDTAYSDTAFEGTLFVPGNNGPADVDGEGFTKVDTVMYAVEATNVRPRPSFDDDPTYWLNKDEEVHVIGIRDDGWAKITVGEMTLYVRYLQLSTKKADEYYRIAKSLFSTADKLSIDLLSKDGESSGILLRMSAVRLQSESPAFSIINNSAETVILGGYCYSAYANGSKVKYEADMSTVKSTFFSFGAYVPPSYADFDSCSLSMEYDSITLTLSGISVETFAEKILGITEDSFDSPAKFSEFCATITNLSYSVDIVFDSNENVTRIVNRYSYTLTEAGADPVEVSHESTADITATAKDITLPEDADSYIPEA